MMHSAPIGNSAAKPLEDKEGQKPSARRNQYGSDVAGRSRNASEQRRPHHLNQVIDRVEFHENEPPRTRQAFRGPKERRDQHGNLQGGGGQMLHISKSQAEHSNQQRKPNAVDEDEKDTGERQQNRPPEDFRFQRYGDQNVDDEVMEKYED